MSVHAQNRKPPVPENALTCDWDGQTHPLESIAQVLERIEENLVRIADAVEKNDAGDRLHQQLASIDQAIRIQGLEQRFHTQR